MPWTVRGKLKILWPAPTDIRHRNCPSVRSARLRRWITATHRSDWASMVSRHHQGATKTRPRQRRRRRQQHGRRGEEGKRSGETKTWGFFLFLPPHRKKISLKRNKKKGIAYFYFVRPLWGKEQNPNVLFLAQLSIPAIGLLCKSVLGRARPPLLHYPVTQTKSSHRPLAGGGHGNRFAHSCSHWERTVIKLLIAWTFLCVFARHVQKWSDGCKSQPSCGSWQSVVQSIFIYLSCHKVPLYILKGHDLVKQEKYVHTVKQSIRGIHLPNIN